MYLFTQVPILTYMLSSYSLICPFLPVSFRKKKHMYVRMYYYLLCVTVIIK